MKISKNIISFVIIGGLGTLFHFVYNWTNNNMLAGFIFPVNESIWEHLKLIFYPALIYFTAEWLIKKQNNENNISSIAISIFCGMFTTVFLYYLYSGILGYNVDFLNILIFFISIIALIRKRNKIINSEKHNDSNTKIILVMALILTALLFAVWSYNPPHLGIFIPPTR